VYYFVFVTNRIRLRNVSPGSLAALGGSHRADAVKVLTDTHVIRAKIRREGMRGLDAKQIGLAIVGGGRVGLFRGEVAAAPS
jgi:hypothetical protein